MADDLRCFVCGNVGRFVVTVTNPSVRDGQLCRNVCSRMCGHIAARDCMAELEAICGYRTKSVYEIRPHLSAHV